MKSVFSYILKVEFLSYFKVISYGEFVYLSNKKKILTNLYI